MSHTAVGEITVGKVVNLLSNDVNRFDLALRFLHFLWVTPLQTILFSYFLWREIGVSSLFGVAIWLLSTALQGSYVSNNCNQSVDTVSWKSVNAWLVFRMGRKKNVRTSVEGSNSDGQKSELDEGNHRGHTSNQNVHVGKALCKTNRTREKVRGFTRVKTVITYAIFASEWKCSKSKVRYISKLFHRRS